MLITCPECGSSVSNKAAFCPHCGYSTLAQKKPLKRRNTKPRKYPKLPNGFGSIKKLSGRRTNPYAVYPPVPGFDEDGKADSVKAIAYVADWYTGFGILSAYHAGTYKPGQEIVFDDTQITDKFVNGIISAFNYGISARKSEIDKTFAEVYAEYVKWDFGALDACEDATERRRIKTRKNSMDAAYKNCSALHNRVFRNLKYADLQGVIDDCPLKHSSKELIIVLFHKLYKYADITDLQKEDRSRHVAIKTKDDDESGVPFTMDELRIIWENKKNPTLEMVMIMCLSGYRIKAYENMEVNLESKYFKGGVKTKNGQNRIVPIHPAIFPLVEKRMERDGKILSCSSATFRQEMYVALEKIGIKKHTPHDCRDTFATLCDRFGVDRYYTKRLMGHSLSADITQEKYIHPETETLRAEIEKIDLSLIVANDI